MASSEEPIPSECRTRRWPPRTPKNARRQLRSRKSPPRKRRPARRRRRTRSAVCVRSVSRCPKRTKSKRGASRRSAFETSCSRCTRARERITAVGVPACGSRRRMSRRTWCSARVRDRYFSPPYVGPSGWIGAWLDKSPLWGEITELLRDAYRLKAPKKLAERSRTDCHRDASVGAPSLRAQASRRCSRGVAVSRPNSSLSGRLRFLDSLRSLGMTQ